MNLFSFQILLETYPQLFINFQVDDYPYPPKFYDMAEQVLLT